VGNSDEISDPSEGFVRAIWLIGDGMTVREGANASATACGRLGISRDYKVFKERLRYAAALSIILSGSLGGIG
jgi:hypothetical protein